MKKGESKDITKSYPEDFADPDLAGTTKRLRVTLTDLKEKELPVLDDEFAQDVDEKYKTLADLRNSVQERFAKNLEERLRTVKINAALERIMEAAPVDLPESMIRFQLDAQMRNAARQMNMPMDALTQLLRKSPDNMADRWRPDAVRGIHSRIILEEIMKTSDIAVSEEDITIRLERIAQESGSSTTEIRAYYEKEGAREYLTEDIKEQKAYDLLIAESRFKIGPKKSYLEFIQNTDANT
jgi:trigger factor